MNRQTTTDTTADTAAEATADVVVALAGPRPDCPYGPAYQPPLRIGPVKLCPTCRAVLDGGPVEFRCDPCGKAVWAADLDPEFHPDTPAPLPHPSAGALRRAA